MVRFDLWLQVLSDSCLALVSCLFGGYNLHRFSDVLGLVLIFNSYILMVNCYIL